MIKTYILVRFKQNKVVVYQSVKLAHTI